jgi:hypothetical protein
MDNKKPALLVLERESIRVIYGSSMKIIKTSEAGLPHNIAFFDKLFAENRVLAIEKVKEMGKDQLFGFLNQKAPQQQQPASLPSSLPPSAVSQPAAVPQQRQADLNDGSFWVKSNAKTTIIIDDLFTNAEIPNAPGCRQALSVSPERPVNLANYNPEDVNKSGILRRLLTIGTLARISPNEASHMDAAADARANGGGNEVDRYAPLIPDGVGAAAYAAGYRGAHDEATVVDITSDFKTSHGDQTALYGSNEDSGSMEGLMQYITQPPPMEQAEEVQEKRQLQARQKIDVVGPSLKEAKFRRKSDEIGQF